MVYILDHYYSIDHKKYCLIVNMDKTVDEVVEICSAIEFLLEDTVDVGIELDDKILLVCLEKFYDAHDVKGEYDEQALKKFNLPIESRYEYLGNDTYIIDLYEARDYCCGSKYKKIMKRWLPKGEQFIQMKNIIQFNNPDSILVLMKRFFNEKYPKYKDELDVSIDFSNNKFNIQFRGFSLTDKNLMWLTVYGFNGDPDEEKFYLNLDMIFSNLLAAYDLSINRR